MKTVLFLGFDNTRGLTYHFVDWAIASDKLAHEKLKMIFVTLKRELYPGLHQKLRQLQFTNVILIDDLKDMGKLKILHETDIVHCHGFKQVVQLLKIKRTYKLNFKIIVTMHAFRNSSRYRILYTNLVSLLYMNKIEAVHFLSNKAEGEFIQYNMFSALIKRSFMCPLGCNKDEFTNDEMITDYEFYNDLDKSNKNIVYIATFSPNKLHIWLIKAIKEVLLKEKAKLWLLGDGPEREKIITYVNQNSLSEYIKMPGRIDRKFIPSIIKKMNIAVCVSKSETFGHLIVEPMFAELPLVTFNVGAAGDVIRDFTNGFVIRNKSKQKSFQKAIEFLLRNPEMAAEMGKNGKLFANKWLTWDNTAMNLMNVYRSIS